MNPPEVTIYSGTRCAYCNAAKRLLDSKGINYTEINIDEDPDLRNELVERTNRQTVPQIFFGDEYVGGFDDLSELNHEGKLDKLLNL